MTAARLPHTVRALDNHRERLAWIIEHAAGPGRAWAIHARDQLGAIALRIRLHPLTTDLDEADAFIDALAGPIDTAVRVITLDLSADASIPTTRKQQ